MPAIWFTACYCFLFGRLGRLRKVKEFAQVCTGVLWRSKVPDPAGSECRTSSKTLCSQGQVIGSSNIPQTFDMSDNSDFRTLALAMPSVLSPSYLPDSLPALPEGPHFSDTFPDELKSQPSPHPIHPSPLSTLHLCTVCVITNTWHTNTGIPPCLTLAL